MYFLIITNYNIQVKFNILHKNKIIKKIISWSMQIEVDSYKEKSQMTLPARTGANKK